MLGSISNNLQAWRPATLSKRDSNTGVYCGYYEIFKNSFLIEHLRLLLLTVLPHYSKVSWGVCSLFSILIKSLRKALLKKFFTIVWPNNFFLAWIYWSRAFDFRIWFGKTFWWETYTKRCANNYVTSLVKRLSSPALCGWSSAFSFKIWFGKRKNAV